jgi:hypothetical protein
MDMTQTMISDIDALVQADKELKALEERVKAMKDAVANKYGEGKHLGDLYSVTITLSQRNVVAWKKVAEQANVPAEIIAKNTSTTSIITVKPSV